MFNLFKKKRQKPPYLHRIDSHKNLDIVRLTGRITHEMIPVIEARIQMNRKEGSTIDRNILLDYALVVDVDSATLAFHMLHFKEYKEKGYKVGFININHEFKTLVEIFKENDFFNVYASEEEAVRELSK
jgi:anti-anti-sigma regulatory factor